MIAFQSDDRQVTYQSNASSKFQAQIQTSLAVALPQTVDLLTRSKCLVGFNNDINIGKQVVFNQMSETGGFAVPPGKRKMYILQLTTMTD